MILPYDVIRLDFTIDARHALKTNRRGLDSRRAVPYMRRSRLGA
jgi:hypothetical protein